jgi:quercetin dioxygenase-like cupin family protein
MIIDEFIPSLPEIQPGSIVSRKLVVTQDVRVVGFAMAEGQELTSHTSPMHVILHVVNGTAGVELGGRTVLLEAGEAIDLPADVPHAVSARTDLRFLLEMQSAKTG